MTLEVLHAAGRGRRRSVDILLVHGIFVGAWIWEEHFMPYLAEAGYDVYALSLSGHGRSCGHERIHTLTLNDYTTDLAEAASTLRRPVVAVGHSMGGAVVQSAIASGSRFAGAALIASVPPSGLMAANLAMMWSQPILWRELSMMFMAGFYGVNLDVLRDGLFSNRIDRSAFESFARRGGPESAFISLELQGLRPFAPPAWLAPPILVMGGTEDRFIRRQDLWATAAWYGVEAQLLESLSHAVMLDPAWKIAADRLLQWLETLDGGIAKNGRSQPDLNANR